MIKPGAQIPDISVPVAPGENVRLRTVKRPIVLFFYPKAFSPKCTQEACAFRDNYPALTDFNALVLGVSRDDAKSQREFAGEHNFPFPLISDHDGAISLAFDTAWWKGRVPISQRVTYVIDETGVVRLSYRDELRGASHVVKALEALAALNRPATR